MMSFFEKKFIDSDQCMHHRNRNCSYLAASTNDKYHKKQQILMIIPKISDSKLETGKFGPKPGVSGLSGRADSSGHGQYSKEYLNQSHPVDVINTRAKE